MLNSFTPGVTSTIAVNTGSQRVAIPRGSSNQVMVTVVAGGQVTFVKFGDVTVSAAITDTPVLPGTQVIFSVAPSQTHIAAIVGTSTSTLYATAGAGQ